MTLPCVAWPFPWNRYAHVSSTSGMTFPMKQVRAWLFYVWHDLSHEPGKRMSLPCLAWPFPWNRLGHVSSMSGMTFPMKQVRAWLFHVWHDLSDLKQFFKLMIYHDTIFLPINADKRFGLRNDISSIPRFRYNLNCKKDYFQQSLETSDSSDQEKNTFDKRMLFKNESEIREMLNSWIWSYRVHTLIKPFYKRQAWSHGVRMDIGLYIKGFS